MIAVARSLGIKIFGAGTNDKWYSNDFLERLIGRPIRYIGVKYIDRTFWRNASESCVIRVVKWTIQNHSG